MVTKLKYRYYRPIEEEFNGEGKKRYMKRNCRRIPIGKNIPKVFSRVKVVSRGIINNFKEIVGKTIKDSFNTQRNLTNILQYQTTNNHYNALDDKIK